MAGAGIIFIILFWPLLLPVFILYFIGAAIALMVPVLLIWNLFVLIGLLVIRHIWKASGTYDRSYIRTKSGGLKWLLYGLHYGLLVFIVWSILLVLACIGLLFWMW